MPPREWRLMALVPIELLAVPLLSVVSLAARGLPGFRAPGPDISPTLSHRVEPVEPVERCSDLRKRL